VKTGQCVVDLFAGVGSFSILIGRTVPDASLVAVDKNPAAVGLLKENIWMNGLENVRAVEDDARHAAVKLEYAADHGIMNLPQSAREFRDSGILAAKVGGMVHFYDITPEDDLYGTSWALIEEAAARRQKRRVKCVDRRVVRSHAPHQYHKCIELRD